MNSNQRFQRNLHLWAKTCPKQAVLLPYVNNAHLVECFTTKGEENLKTLMDGEPTPLHSQAGALEEAHHWWKTLGLQDDVPLVCVYGIGLGYYYDVVRAWLKKSRKRRIVFLEDDLAVIQKFLTTPRATQMLQDAQAQLLYFKDLQTDNAIFEGLYWNFAMHRLAVTALGSYGTGKAAVLDQLRHKIAYDAAMKNALVDEYLRYAVSFYINFYQNMLHIEGSYLGNRFFGKFHKVPAIICGAGPSLAKNLPLLKQLRDKALIFAGGSALNVLNGADFQPHFGAGIDPNSAQYTRMSQNTGYEVPFFYRNRMYHDAFKMIHGPRLYVTGSGGYDTAEFFEKKLGIKGGGELDEGHNVVNLCVEVAQAMGCDPIIFVGMDLAFTGMHVYAPGVIENAQVCQSAILDVEDEDSKAIVKQDIEGNPTYTLWKWVAESDWIGDYAKEHPSIAMINCTEGGLGFPGIPNQTLKDAAEQYLGRSYELNNRIHGETQNSAMPRATRRKVVKAMKELSSSLKRVIDHLSVLTEDAKGQVRKIQAGEETVIPSGRAALAEADLAEEIGYQHVVGVFNEVYARMASRDMHDIQVRRYSEKQRKIKRLKLSCRKFKFLIQAAQVNDKLIDYALSELTSKKHRKERDAEKQESLNEAEIEEADAAGPLQICSISNKKIVIDDPECGIHIEARFNPVLVPEERVEGKKLTKSHVLRMHYDNKWKLCECYVEKDGQPDGQALLFYSNGRVKAESFYSEGKLHGPAFFYGKEGNVLAESVFIHGKQEGKCLWYYPSGALYSLQRYKNNRWQGWQRFYRQDGEIKTSIHYDNGRLVNKKIKRL